jgi:CrcB protein
MNVYSWIAVGAGGAVGSWLRWWFNLKLTPLFPPLPLGTVAANLLAGFIMGIAMETFGRYVIISPEVRLLITTGFLGGLSTFSTFSADVTTLLMRQEYLWGAAAIAIHVIGSLSLTFLGIYAAKLILSEV